MNSYQSIQFCEDCENKLYHFVDNETLVFICRVCGKKEDIDNDSLCVLNLEYNTEFVFLYISFLRNRFFFHNALFQFYIKR